MGRQIIDLSIAIEAIADIKSTSPQAVAATVTENTHRLYVSLPLD